jgi:hypothetical protein
MTGFLFCPIKENLKLISRHYGYNDGCSLLLKREDSSFTLQFHWRHRFNHPGGTLSETSIAEFRNTLSNERKL